MADKKDTKMEVDEPKKEEPKLAEKDLKALAVEEIKEHCIALEKGEHHTWGRLMQNLHQTRKQLHPEIFTESIEWPLAMNPQVKQYFAKYGSSGSSSQQLPMEVDQKTAKSPNVRRKTGTQEGDVYMMLLAALYYFDRGMLKEAKEGIMMVISKIDEMDRPHLDVVTAKGLYYFALIAEKEGNLYELRSVLNSRLRTATLRHLDESQAVLINTLLRLYIINRQYEAAAKLVSKVRFPEGASNNDLARFLYYQGRIRALQLDYTAAAAFFMNALRKAPQEAAIGFKQNAQKWVVVINLLQGEIPERSIFRQPIFRKCLAPYLELTQAVRLGDLALFNKVLNQYSAVYEKDETLTLIVRLRQNVIKTAVKQISVAYSRITIKDIARKLQLQSEVDTEYMVAKAIADGAIDASITCDTKDGLRYMQSSETADIYRTTEPQLHFDTRIKYCLDLHNHAVKALRYPPKNKIEVETIEAQREREQQELEFAKELAEDDDDDF